MAIHCEASIVLRLFLQPFTCSVLDLANHSILHLQAQLLVATSEKAVFSVQNAHSCKDVLQLPN